MRTSTIKIYYKENGTVQEWAVPVLQEAEHEEELMKSDFVKLSWSDTEKRTIPVDAYVIPYDDGIQYSLLEPYEPEQQSEAEWHYEPHFHHPKMYLGKVTFRVAVKDTQDNDIDKIDWPFTGSVSSLLNGFVIPAINRELSLNGVDEFGVVLKDFDDRVITANFDSTDILSALSTVANICECEWHIGWEEKTLYFGHISLDNGLATPTLTAGWNVSVPSMRNSKEGYWNAFEPQGSTRNILRRTASQELVQSDVRLSLNREVYPDGIIYTDGKGHEVSKDNFTGKLFLKPLILEDVYPRMDMYVYDVKYRECYLTDDNGNKVVSYTDDDGTEHYLRYAKWYFRLAVPTKNAQGEAVAWSDYAISEYAVGSVVSFTEGTNGVTVFTDIRYTDGMVGLWFKLRVADSTVTVKGINIPFFLVSNSLRFYVDRASNAGAYNSFVALLRIGAGLEFIDNIDITKFPKENRVSQIIDGKKPVVAFQPNNYKVKTGTDANGADIYEYAESTPLAGLGAGDGNGHYGFPVRYMGIEGSNYVRKANEEPTEDGDTGVLDAITGRRAVISSHDYEVEFGQNDTVIIPSTIAQGIIPKGDSRDNSRPSLFGNKVNLYNVAMGREVETAAQAELASKTMEYITKLTKDRNTYTVKSNPVAFHTANPNLFIGQKVFFDDGLDMDSQDRSAHILETRVMKLVTKLDYEFEQEISVGNEVLKGSQTKTKENVEAIVSGNMSVGTVVSDSYIRMIVSNWVTPRFLSKLYDDTTEGTIGFLRGLWVKAQNLFGISADGDATVRSLKATGAGSGTTTDASGQTKGLGLEVTESGVIGGILRVAQSILTRTIQSIGFSGGDSMFGTGWQLTDDDGSDSSRLVVDKLFVRKKAMFNEVEVRKMVAIGGNYAFSPAASIIEEVDYIKLAPVPGEVDVYTETVLGYEYLSVPWVLRLVPLSLQNKLLSRRKLFRSTMTDEDWAQVSIFRCWLKADDGTTRTINTWQTGMMARCQTYDVAASPDGTHTGEAGSTATQSKYYWRAVTAKGENVTRQTYTKLTKVLDDGLGHHYIDLANTSPFYDTGSDRPSAGDSIACFGNYLNRELSNLITIETVGSEAPCIRELLGVGYDDGIVPRWSLEGCERTRISPVAGNRFVAPSFEIETTGGATEKLYNVVEKGTAVDFRPDTPYITTGRVGDILLVKYASWTATGTHLLRCTAAGSSQGGEITLPVYESLSASLGDGYVLDVNGHLYVATQTGWEDRGLVDEAKSSLKVTMDGITAEVRQLKEGKNLLTGVLTGDKWRSESSHTFPTHQIVPVSVDDDSFFVCDTSINDKHVSSPLITLQKGTDYTLSFEGETTGSVNIYVFDPSHYQEQPAVFKPTTSGKRKTVTFQITGTGTISVYININTPKLRYPQLEVGVNATEFVVSQEEVSSVIKQTADRITLAVKSDLGSTGVDIDRQTVELRGDKVTFTNTAGTVSGKISIDPTTGTLHAVDGVFEGSVKATDLFRPACQWWGMVNYHNFDNDDGKGQWFYVTDLSGFTAIVRDGGGTVPGTFQGGYVSFRQIESWGYQLDVSTFASDLTQPYCCIPCSYNSQMVYVRGSGFKSQDNNILVALPRPEDFHGMLVHVFNQRTTDSISVIETEGRNRFMFEGLALIGVRSDTPMGNVTVNAGYTRDFMSVPLTQSNVTTWYWLAL